MHFNTIYPGWYPGRAVHIHMKVFVGGNSVHTGQLFFPDADVRIGVPEVAVPRHSRHHEPGRQHLHLRRLGRPPRPEPSSDGFTATAQLVVRA